MKTIFTLLVFSAFNLCLLGQNKCATAALSQRIDSICKVYNISKCDVYFNYSIIVNGNSNGTGSELKTSGFFKFDDCFLIVGDKDKRYFDLSHLVDFYLIFKTKNWGTDKLIISFQGI